MMNFFFTVDGVPNKEDADLFWTEIERFGVNFTVLEKKCYLYGEASEPVINDLSGRLLRFGFPVSLERRNTA